MSRLFRSLSFRLAVLYAVLFGISVVVLIGAIYWIRYERPLDAMRASVTTEAEAYQTIARSRGLGETIQLLNRRAKERADRKPFHAVIASDGTVLSRNLPSWPSRSIEGLNLMEADILTEGDEIDYSALVLDQTIPDGTRLIVGRDVEDITRLREQLEAASFWLVVGTLILGLTGGWLMSRAIGKRIDSVTRAALLVMEGDLTGRVEMRGTNDDFDRLGDTLNLMLERIQTLFAAVQRVSDHITHELRTPLARLVGKLEEIEKRPPGDPGLPALIGDASMEAARLQRIFAAILRISRIEQGRHAIQRKTADVVTIVEDVVELYQPVAEVRGIALTVKAERPLIAAFDVDLVFQALSNLIDNALKHTPPSSSVEIVASKTGGVTITVADTGVGLSPEERARVTEPFYRSSLAHDLPGDGLGLSMVAAIARAHGARLSIEDNEPGLRVTLAFPEGE
ncbi:HAMP domain-containing sensor histidine kinase [Croceicoccus naphthovorans]|uniref:histidine kinase n=1 Tax=Croceicoccus naphthovorans TaxID=1348774 RepID=A0A0G3XE48_9SPHN|nr:HAMP domain-containing sensor histidine kinase [Croceicoccus naphthovorans]AKM08916.1 hypothetical protein AB433_01280 [Croceicoccus naphthovorans]MBB3989307.1 signal transduction histidine kinase [Croceicoccus naphthovorans]